MFPSETKQFQQFAGLEFVKEVAGEIRLPSFAIGGVDETRLPELLAAGGSRVAISHAIWHASELGASAERIKAELLRANPSLFNVEL